MTTVLLLGSAQLAVADADSEIPKVQEAPTERRWYGLPIVVSDVASDAALFLIPPVGLAGLTLGGPIVHWAHGNVGTGFGSLALRTAANVVALVIFVRFVNCDSCSRSSLALAVAPIVAVQVIDSAVLAWERVAAPSYSLVGRQGSGLRLGPTITMLRSGGALGVAGTF